MQIRNVLVYDTQVPHLKSKHLCVTSDGRATIVDHIEKAPKDIVCLEAKSQYVLMPGMLDAHVHGQGGFDFADVGDTPASLPKIVAALGKTGLSYVMATLVSLELTTLTRCLKVIDKFVQKQATTPIPGQTNIVGIHLEGPFIAKNCRGAHAESALQESISIKKFCDIIASAPHIKQWKITLAPDLPGADLFIQQTKELEKKGIFVKVFIGHTNPVDKTLIDKAIANGAIGFTHLGNACQETCCREARKLAIKDASSHVVQWVLENPDLCPPGVELIVDGVHLSQSFVKLVRDTIGDKIVLVTDALGPAGLPDGKYRLGTLSIRKEANNFYLANEAGEFIMKEGLLADGAKGKVKSLAGSAAPLSFCIETYSRWIATGIEKSDQSLADKMSAIYYAVIENPRITSLSPQAIACLPDNKNFALFDTQGKLVLSMCNGAVFDHQHLLSPNKNGGMHNKHVLLSRCGNNASSELPENNSDLLSRNPQR